MLTAVALTILLTGALSVAGPVRRVLHVDPGKRAPRPIGIFAFYSPILDVVRRIPQAVSSSALRCELSHRNAARAAAFLAEMSYSPVPSVIYAEDETGQHGNFLPAAYKRILQQPAWKARLAKAYTGSRFLPRRADRTRGELECANSSDALLMNIFCYPGILRRRAVCSLLAIPPGLRPQFGVRPGIPLKNGSQDRSEMDLKLGDLLMEAKLTEGDFQTARCDLVHRYRDLDASVCHRSPAHAQGEIPLLPIDSRRSGGPCFGGVVCCGV